jgi:hypothetical protein
VIGVAGGVGVLVFAGVSFALHDGSGPSVAHTLVTPQSLDSYTQVPDLAKEMGAAALRQQIITGSHGEAKNVVYAVYEDSSGPAAKHGPQIMLFIGGNLTGTSPDAFISSFTGKLEGAASTSAGPMGGQAACVPSEGNRLAECAWADNDTFGVVTSPTLTFDQLGAEMRTVRPKIEIEKRASR